VKRADINVKCLYACFAHCGSWSLPSISSSFFHNYRATHQISISYDGVRKKMSDPLYEIPTGSLQAHRLILGFEPSLNNQQQPVYLFSCTCRQGQTNKLTFHPEPEFLQSSNKASWWRQQVPNYQVFPHSSIIISCHLWGWKSRPVQSYSSCSPYWVTKLCDLPYKCHSNNK
jgi:hypothetical protein